MIYYQLLSLTSTTSRTTDATKYKPWSLLQNLCFGESYTDTPVFCTIKDSTDLSRDGRWPSISDIIDTPLIQACTIICSANHALQRISARGSSTTWGRKTENALLWLGEIEANGYAYSFSSFLSPDLTQELAVKNVNFW